jgi:hypothetical protein
MQGEQQQEQQLRSQQQPQQHVHPWVYAAAAACTKALPAAETAPQLSAERAAAGLLLCRHLQ